MPESTEEKTNPLVSAIMPVFNSERFLGEAIESVLAQDYSPLELIIVNDGSRDRSVRIAESYRRSDGSVRIIDMENGGPARARNRGMAEASGEFLAFIDADDLWLPDKISRQMAIFAKDPEIGIVYSQRENIDANGRVFRGYEAPIFSGDVLQHMYVDNFICCSSAVIRRSVYEKLDGFDPELRMSEDFDFFLRAACFFSMKGISRPLVRYRSHSNQTSVRTEERIRVVREIRERFDRDFGRRIRWKARMNARSRHFVGKAVRAQVAGQRWNAFKAGCCALMFYPLEITPFVAVSRTVLPREFVEFLKKHARGRGPA